MGNIVLLIQRQMGKALLKKAEALNPDVIFTDIRMPIFDGLEFVGKLREKGISAKTVLISGYKEFEYAKKAITLGVEDYLVKPINPLVLQKILQKMKAELQEDIHEKQEAYLQAVIHGGKIEMEDCFLTKKQKFVYYICALAPIFPIGISNLKSMTIAVTIRRSYRF